jgi:hypothetical protein
MRMLVLVVVVVVAITRVGSDLYFWRRNIVGGV